MDTAGKTTGIQKTPLYEEHLKAKAKMIDFSGWLLPINYADGVLKEHAHVREHCGLFDVSHMGEVRVDGPDAENFLQFLTINDINRIKPGAGQYSAILNERGGIIDDLIIYCLAENDYFICVNAANTTKDFNWIAKNSEDFDVRARNQSEAWSQLAIQGPKSKLALAPLVNAADMERFSTLGYMQIMSLPVLGEKILLARTGYTGEFGYEIYLPPHIASQVWQKLMATSGESNIKPIGLGARDTLRLEACYLLYGNDMNETVTPLEAGMEWVVRWNCGEFMGKGALDAQRVYGVKRQNFAFQMIDKAIPRHGMDVYKGDALIGRVGSGSVLPTLESAGGLALLAADQVKVGDEVFIDVRGARKLAKLVKRPLYSAKVR